jgi:hypothetical protein
VSERTSDRLLATKEPPASIRWIKGRAYAELGGWSPWGGRRQEPLRPLGEKFATNNPNTAAILFGYRLAELRDVREAMRRMAARADPTPSSIPEFIAYHLRCKERAVGRRVPSKRDLRLQGMRLQHAAEFFESRGIHHMGGIDREIILAYTAHLRNVRRVRGRARHAQPLSLATQRKYLGALRNLLRRAKGKGRIGIYVAAELEALLRQV